MKSLSGTLAGIFELNEIFNSEDLDLGEVKGTVEPTENKKSEESRYNSNSYLEELNEKHLKQVLTQESVKKTCKRLAEQIAKNCPFIKAGQKISFTVQVNI